MFVAAGTRADNGQDGLLAFGETCVRLVRPLHWCPSTLPFRQREVVSHPQLVSVAKNRSAGKMKHSAVSKLDSPAVVFEHRSKATPDAAIIELHRGLRPEGFENRFPLLISQAAEIQFVMIA